MCVKRTYISYRDRNIIFFFLQNKVMLYPVIQNFFFPVSAKSIYVIVIATLPNFIHFYDPCTARLLRPVIFFPRVRSCHTCVIVYSDRDYLTFIIFLDSPTMTLFLYSSFQRLWFKFIVSIARAANLFQSQDNGLFSNKTG